MELKVLNITRKEEYMGNVSDHYPVSMSMSLNFCLTEPKPVKDVNFVPRINWKKIDKQHYSELVTDSLVEKIGELCNEDLNKTVTTINTIMTENAKLCAPRKRGKHKKSAEFRVKSVAVHTAAQAKKKAFYNWKTNGRPNDPGNFYLMEKKITSIELRRQIRIELALHRNNSKKAILDARQSDTALFHKLIRKQRGQCLKFIDELSVNTNHYSGEDVLLGWREHFSNLATKNYSDDFDTSFLSQVENEASMIYRICLESCDEPQYVSDDEMLAAVNSLNRGKAADGYGVQVEHVYYGGQELLNTVKSLINNILFEKTVPSTLKLGILNPIFKNKGSLKESVNYRGITITPVLTRLIEAVLKLRINSTLLNKQNSLQRGFTKNSSPMNCALLVEEFFRNNKDLHKPTYIAFMDAKSAFDVVIHSNLMRKLYYHGIQSHEWLLIDSLHRDAMTSVKWRGKLSSPYVNQQGVRQGGVLSADLYKVYNNDQLDRLQHSGKGASIGNICLQSPACADDVAVLSNNAEDLQFLINICKDSSEMDGYMLHVLKSVVLKMNSISQYPEDETWCLGEKGMPVVDSTSHMGILRTSSNQELNAVEYNIQKAKRTAYSLMGAGLHGENGMDPETAMSLLNTYVFPVLFYGLEIIVPTGKALNCLDTQFKRLIKQILSLPTTVADPAVYLLSGTLPAEAYLHKQILSLFGNISRLPNDSVESQLASRQLETKSYKSHSWFIVVKKVLLKYDLPSPEELLECPIKKLSWKSQCDKAVNNYWSARVLAQSRLYSSLKFMSKSYTIGKCHPAVRPYSLSFRDISRIPVKNKILTGTYILQTNRVKFKQNEVNPTCQLCYDAEETLDHFLLECRVLDFARNPIVLDIQSVLSDLLGVCPAASDFSLLQLIVDCSAILDGHRESDCKELSELVDTLHYHSRRLTYTLHAKRYQILELSSKSKKSKRLQQSTGW